MSPATRHKPQKGPQLVQQREPEIGWDAYPRIEPGAYLGYCASARIYRDPGFKRWVALLRWDVLNISGLQTVARGVPMWMSLGDGEKPQAGRRSRYWREYIRAAGKPPARSDRLSPAVFVKRMARLLIRDTVGEAPYSVITEIHSWETGTGESSCHVVMQSGRPRVKGIEGKDL